MDEAAAAEEGCDSRNRDRPGAGRGQRTSLLSSSHPLGELRRLALARRLLDACWAAPIELLAGGGVLRGGRASEESALHREERRKRPRGEVYDKECPAEDSPIEIVTYKIDEHRQLAPSDIIVGSGLTHPKATDASTRSQWLSTATPTRTMRPVQDSVFPPPRRRNGARTSLAPACRFCYRSEALKAIDYAFFQQISRHYTSAPPRPARSCECPVHSDLWPLKATGPLFRVARRAARPFSRPRTHSPNVDFAFPEHRQRTCRFPSSVGLVAWRDVCLTHMLRWNRRSRVCPPTSHSPSALRLRAAP